ncbi:MAG: ATP-dependent DNA helicase RecG [Candidatus Omnitrophica bacterium]|nr:ATP-dependent DNA helicase RecG [Candidatus Omnitrophota bacterium]
MEPLQKIAIQFLKGIGPKRAESFAKHGINNVEDLFYYFPRRYEDRTKFVPIAMLQEGEPQTIKASVVVSNQRRSWRRRGFSITQAMVDDKTGRLETVWFNQPYLKKYLEPGVEVILYGKPEHYAGRLQMSNPEFEIVSKDAKDESLNIGRIVPVYTAPSGIGQRSFRKLMRSALDKYVSGVEEFYVSGVEEFLPYDIRSKNGLSNLAESILNIHFPKDEESRLIAYKRLAFEEFFLFQVPCFVRKLLRVQASGIAHMTKGPMVDGFIKALPFSLTDSQIQVLGEIEADMARPHAMHRLLQGDVGSGKTVVATIAAVMAVQGRYQSAFMVPTEILAKQHFDKIKQQVSVVSSQGSGLRIALLTSGLLKKDKEKIIQEIRDGSIDLVIGTHALLEEDVKFSRLGLVIIDEQHRFGVGQRALLPQKGDNPDVLIMTATPIPRTLAITIYGDLDISAITSLPPGRRPITTRWISGDKRQWLYGFIKKEVQSGRQAYIVYPLIEESFAVDLLSAEKMHAELSETVFKGLNVGLIHGRLKQSQQDSIMSDFKAGRIHVLIATTVLEVGIDVANATVMAIEHADRFGLSQLHQLRGRIGRGKFDSTCILISDAGTDESKARLGAMVASGDGFKIAEEDLKIRGPGEYFGSRQHGLTGLRIGNPLTQMQLLKKAREEAAKIVGQDPHLTQRVNQPLKQKLIARFPEYEKLIMVG